jgi:hypothetical protein
VQITCLAPDSDAADEIVQQGREYFRANTGTFVIPPWSTLQTISPAQRKARRTYLAIQDTQNVYDDPRFAELTESIRVAMRSGDSAAITGLTAQQGKLAEKLQSEKLDGIRMNEALYDPQVVDHYLAAPSWTDPDTEDEQAAAPELDFVEMTQAWARKMGDLLGQLTMDGDEPAPHALSETTDMGTVESIGPVVTFQFVIFRRVDRGAPLLANWLCRRGCTDLKYSLSSGAGGEMFDE